MEFGEEVPLGEAFYNNPYEYLQNYVKNMNNEFFLSQYQINNLYALLLITRACPWDHLRTSNSRYKDDVNGLVDKKINDVKDLLDSMSQLYEDKVKKATFSQIERLMSILKAKRKSIFIQKYENGEYQDDVGQESPKKQNQFNDSNTKNSQHNCQNKSHHTSMQQQTQQQKPISSNNLNLYKHNSIDDIEVFGMIQGLGNIPNLSALALSNCLEYNTSERYIKFKMSKNYVMTIKNEDPVSYDLTSIVAKVPSNLFVHHIFPYLTARELFQARGVCKEWLGLVKETWHSTFKRQMYVQLLAGQFCKDIEFFYKCIQLRNPFFQKLSLLLHALIQIIQWQQINTSIQQNTINMPCKRVLIVLLKLLGEDIVIGNFNDLNQQLWQQQKHKVLTLKEKVVHFFSNFSGNSMTINELRDLKAHIFNHPFMRADEMQTQEKTPLLLLIFIKQLNLQQVLKNHLHFSQEYLLNSKKRLDNISSQTPHQHGLLEGIYKILLLKTLNPKQTQQMENDEKQLPGFGEMVEGVLHNKQSNQPDFYIKTKSSQTSIYLDRATKLDIIISTLRKSCRDEESSQDKNNFNEPPQLENQINNEQPKQLSHILIKQEHALIDEKPDKQKTTPEEQKSKFQKLK